MSRFITVPLVLLLASAATHDLSAQDASDFSAVLGAWEMTLETPRGTMTQTLTFVADGDELTGSATAPNGTMQLQNVSFQDGTLTFQVTRSFRNREMTQSYTATADGDQLTGTISGGRGGGQREFTAVRSST